MKTIMLLAPEGMCSVFQYVLSKEYNTLCCSDSIAGEAILLRKPDALILSLFLSGNTGLAFLKHNIASLPPVVIAVTSFINDAILAELSDLGVDSVYLIPCSMPHLKLTLAKLLAEKMPLLITGGVL